MFANSHEAGKMQAEAADRFEQISEKHQFILSEKIPVISAYIEPLPDGLIGDEL